MATASGLLPSLPSRSLVNGITETANRKAAFHRTKPSLCRAIRPNTRWCRIQNWMTT